MEAMTHGALPTDDEHDCDTDTDTDFENDEDHAMTAIALRPAVSAIALLALLVLCQPPAAGAEPPNPRDPMPDQPKHTNHLVGESSPYLLQHAHNPVDWYPWGEEALARARRENKPIFLSIGYAACHWCHVMERESFENEEIAAILNAHFVCIKVDREERPDLDEIYMTATQMLTGSGGWPMSVFLTPELKPFYAGTYFPPEDRYGRPGFKSLLNEIAKVWTERRAEIDRAAERITTAIREHTGSVAAASGTLAAELLTGAVADLARQADRRYGGFGGAPKFPSAPAIAMLLADAWRHDRASSRELAILNLDQMARGGLYDQLGGGFHRYSVDERWLVPHFEKMLYDNAQLVQVYLAGWQLTGRPLYARVVRETLDYLLARMTAEEGGFYSSEDADSDGEEGKYYLWTHAELGARLGEADAALFGAWFNVRPDGNFDSHEPYHEGQNILHVTTSAEVFANEHNLSTAAWLERLDAMKAVLRPVRDQRTHPPLDDKQIVAWNGLTISAFARAGRILDEPRYTAAATKAADFLLVNLRDDAGELLHTWRDGRASLPAYLDDYSYLIVGLVDLYEATFDDRYLDAATGLADAMNAQFLDTEHGGWFYTGDRHPNLIARTRPTYDGATPSGNAMATLGLLRLGLLLDRDDYRDQANRFLELVADDLAKSPRAYLQTLLAADYALHPLPEIVVAGKPASADTRALWQLVNRTYLPHAALAFAAVGDDRAAALAERLPLLRDKTPINGHAAAYVCRGYVCQQPVTDAAALAAQLQPPPAAADE